MISYTCTSKPQLRNDEEFDRLRKEKFEVDATEHDEVWQYETENEDAGDSHNS
jgi:hypothetical protein